MDISLSDGLPTRLQTHRAIIERRTPAWLANAGPDTHTALRKAASQALKQPWLTKARDDTPAIVEQLQALYAEHHHLQQRIAPSLQRLGTLEDFAAPRLTQAIKQQFDLDLDVRAAHLFHASHTRTEDTFVNAAKDPIVQANSTLRAAIRPLLEAALQNFQAEETVPGAMDRDQHFKAGIFANHQVLGPYLQGTPVALPAHEFAALSRGLDLGGEYQKHIDSVFDRVTIGDLQAFERSTLLLQVHLALLKQRIDAPAHTALLNLLNGRPGAQLNGQELYCSALTLWDVELTGVVLISTDRDASTSVQPVMLYIPEDPVAPLQLHASAQALHKALRESLFNKRYADFFSGLLPARQRSHVMNTLYKHLYPKVKKGPWYGQRWLEHEADHNARLKLGENHLAQPLFETLVHRKLTVIKDDARFNGVPTAEQDQRSHEQRMAWWRNKALNVLNIAAFAVPALGAVMLGVTAVQLCYEVYESIESWEHDERQQALSYLLDVVENIALMAAIGKLAAQTAPLPAIEAPGFVETLAPVRLPSGQQRLWKPDLAPFTHDILLPADLKPNALGLYEHQGKQWLVLDEGTYSVKADSHGDFVIEHPDTGQHFEPPLRHNGAGAWLHPLDNPRQMHGLKLLRRLGYDTASLPDAMARQALQASNTSEAVLRHALTELGRPPALLVDTIQRLQLDRELSQAGQPELFDTRYQARQASPVAGVEALQQALPSRLPASVAQELWSHASTAQQQQLLNEHKLPIQLAEEARHYRQQLRLTRAYEGLYRQSSHNPDTDQLILHSLESLVGWSSELRLEIRDGSFNGALLDSVGPVDAPKRKVLIKEQGGYSARDAQDRHLNDRADLYASILHALPDAERQALGIPHTGQRAVLQRLIQYQPLARHQLRRVLAMPEIRPGFRSPMRLADGRIGYLLSGRPGTHWTVSRHYLLDRLSLLEFDMLWPDEMLQRLQDFGMSLERIDARLDAVLEEQRLLRESLETWRGLEPLQMEEAQSVNARLSTAIWRHWTRHSLPELGLAPEPLHLENFALQDFAPQLPAFFEQRVTALQLDDLRPSAAHGRPADLLSVDNQTLHQFLSRWGNARSLGLRNNPGSGLLTRYYPGVLGTVSSSLPNLTDLRLINLQLLLNQAEMDGLLPLLQLRNLELSGNRFSQHQPLSLEWLRPQRLVLEHTELRHWPTWLDSRVPGPIGELSLAGNHLTELPGYILDNPHNPDNHSVIDVRGNPLSMGTILRARLDDALADRSFSYRIDTPAAMEINLGVLISERNALTQAIEGWNEASTSSVTLSPQTIAQRRRIGVALMDHWRAYARGESQTALHLEDMDLAQFPRRLPGFFYLRVRSMRLHRITTTDEQLGNLLRFMINLGSLRISGEMTPLLSPPQALLGLSSFSNLSLIDTNLRIDRRWTDFFARMVRLESLELDGNFLGDVQEVSSLGHLSLRWLSLRNTGLQSWPAWMTDRLPPTLETLILDNNQLQDIPEQLLANPRRQWGHTEISLRGNPLSHEAMLRAHTSQRYGRSYSFEMDLPPQIREIAWYESHDSDSTMTESDYSMHTHSPATSSTLELSGIEPWLDNNTERPEIWRQLEQDGDASHLLALIDYLQQSADYRNQSSRAQLVERVWQVLEAAARSPELRATLDGIAEQPLQMIREQDTCPDGVMVEFNQMEVMVFTQQSLQDLPATSRGAALLNLTRRLYRLHELDRIAREQANGRDEAEVRLAYRLRWAQELDLPVPPQRMLYEAHARLQPDELNAALARVQAGERGDSFLAFAITQMPWVTYLREEYATGFNGLQRIYRDNLNRLTDRYEQLGLSLSSAQFEAEARTLDQQYQDDQLTLLRALTVDAVVSGPSPDQPAALAEPPASGALMPDAPEPPAQP
ncbi:NEL domain-containing protein [Pseudomonas sp. 21LCFQ02]|uniref:NEL domain-containing protein n=1 Tax=Pseudomonas sp. 21LCFQ02 TaxID=2957505 RepID=UPI00209ABAD3|nr:NEL domain-containing protein [Pseudomonas sp. 21LCFQ02]MCO8171334.1 NEL domain-containing protein [Pseudomonas sp. 21LCFQ02]